MTTLAHLWEALTKSRYTRRLECENAELRTQLGLWQNALLESVNLPRLTPRMVESGPAVKLKTRLTPSQYIRAMQRATDTPPEPEKKATV